MAQVSIREVKSHISGKGSKVFYRIIMSRGGVSNKTFTLARRVVRSRLNTQVRSLRLQLSLCNCAYCAYCA